MRVIRPVSCGQPLQDSWGILQYGGVQLPIQDKGHAEERLEKPIKVSEPYIGEVRYYSDFVDYP